MIFGFNSDVKHDETVYHVESEAQPATQTLLTTIFVKGQFLGKRATSYSEQASSSDLSETQIHELLKAQHRQVLEAIREGKLGQVIGASA